MKIQEAAENYLECILIIGKEKGQVRSVDVAHRLEVTKRHNEAVPGKRLCGDG